MKKCECYYCNKFYLPEQMVMRTVYKSTRRGTCKICYRKNQRLNRAKLNPEKYFMCGDCGEPSHRAHRGAGPEVIRLIKQCKYCDSENIKGLE